MFHFTIQLNFSMLKMIWQTILPHTGDWSHLLQTKRKTGRSDRTVHQDQREFVQTQILTKNKIMAGTLQNNI